MYTKDGFHKALVQKLGDDAYLLLANGGHKKLTELLTAASLGASGNSTTLSITVGGTTKTGSVTVPYATNADTVDSIHANGLLTAASLGASGNSTTISVTVGGTTKTGSVTVPYATNTTNVYIEGASGDVNYAMLFTTATANGNGRIYTDTQWRTAGITFNPSSNTLNVGSRITAPYANHTQTSMRHIDAGLNSVSTDHGLYIGYGAQTYTAVTHFYYSTGTTDSTSSRTEFMQINSNGAYALTRFGINGQNTSYNFYVNGSADFSNRLLIDTTGRVYPYSTSTRRAGMYGVYDSTKLGHIWSMGTGYMISDNGADPANLYGLAYFHTNWSNNATYNTNAANKTAVGTYAGNHQVGWFINGVLYGSIGDYIWSRNGFIKNGSNNNYALTGGGGHFAIHTGRNNEANKIVRTDGSGYIQAGWINTTSGDMGTTAIDRIYCSNDTYIRYKTKANFINGLDAYWANIKISSSSSTETNPQVNNIKARVFTILHPTDASSERGTLTYKSGTYGWGDYLTTNANGPIFGVTASSGVYMETSASTGLYVYGGSYYLQFRPESSTWASFYTNSTKYYFNKRIDVNGAIWRYNTNYGIADDGRFYALAMYANRNSSSTDGGVSLYGTDFTYSILFRGTGSYGKLQGIQSDWATYLTMNDDTSRGWMFRRGSTNVLAIDGFGSLNRFYIYRLRLPGATAKPVGWYQMCRISGLDGYFNFNLLTTGGWSTGAPSTALLNIACYNTTPVLTQISGKNNNVITKIRLRNISGGDYYLDVYQAYGYTSSNAMSDEYFLINGSVKVTEIAEPTAVTSATGGTELSIQDISGHLVSRENAYWANIQVSTSSSTSTSPTFSTAYTSNWFRSTGATGWYSESYGGGIRMTDSSWIRTYGSKNFYVEGGNFAVSGSGAIGTTEFSDKLRVYGGILRIDANSAYVRIGPQNSSHCHYETNAGTSHWFNKRVDVNGHVYPYSSNSFDLGGSSNKWRYFYLNNRAYLDEWIQFSAYTGLYWPNANNQAHFHPNNNTSYGTFTIRGNRNGYSGIQLGTSTSYMTIMDNGNDKGAYEEDWGWIWYFNRSNKKMHLRTSSDMGADINLNGHITALNFRIYGSAAAWNCNDAYMTGHFYYTSNGPSTSIGASTSDGALYTQAYSSSWVGQIAQDYRNGGLYVRGKNNGTWQSWYRVWDNRTTYVSGGKGYIGSTEITQVNNSDTVDGYHANRFAFTYNSANYGNTSGVTVNDLVTNGVSNASHGMIYPATDNPVGSANWVHVWSQQWTIGTTSSWVSQIALGVQQGTGMWYRTTSGNIVGEGWTRVLDSSNYTSYCAPASHSHSYLPLSGGTITGDYGALKIKRNSNDYSAIAFYGSSGTLLGYIGANPSKQPTFTNNGNDVYTILHTGNYTSYVATASHNHDDRYLKLSGGTMTGTIVAKTASSDVGIKLGDTYLNAINGSVIFQNNSEIRFGTNAWDYNEWAGLKYNHSSKIVYLGLAASPFIKNSEQSGGKIYTPGISDIYIGNGTYKVIHSGNYTSYCAAASHSHSYLPLSGGTLTGYLTLAGCESNDISNIYNGNGTITNITSTSLAAIRHSIKFPWYSTSWEIGNIRGNSTDSLGFGITKGNSKVVFRVNDSGGWINESQIITSSNISSYVGSGGTGNYLPLSGGTMTGPITIKANQYSPNYGINMNNSDIINVNSIYTADLSDDYTEGILFKRSNGNWDSFRAADGTFYFHFNNGGAIFYVNTAGAYHTSDVRKKYDIYDILNKDVINLFNTENAYIRHFKWRETNKDSYGFIAQELQEYCPEAVNLNNEGYYSVNYNVAFSKIIGAMYKKIKELERRLEEK